MFSQPEAPRTLTLLADLLDYPHADAVGTVRECERLTARIAPQAAPEMSAFREFIEQTSLASLQEIYSGFFDLNPLCHPYVGYHLFGETYKRSVFLLRLKELYRSQRFAVASADLPDRLSVVLRFVARSGESACAGGLIEEGLLPAIERMSVRNTACHPPAAAPACGPELEGHSHGDVLEAGYLLHLSQDDDGSDREATGYWQGLGALRWVLMSLGGATLGPSAQTRDGRNDPC